MRKSQYKSELYREKSSVVFRCENFERSWNEFSYIPQALTVCEIFRGDYEVESFEEYSKKVLGENSNRLDAFRNFNNLQSHIHELRCKYEIEYKKLMYIAFAKKYGMSALNFKKIFNFIMREIWEIKPYFSQFCYTHKTKIIGRKKIGFFYIDDINVRLLHKNLNLLEEANKNNQKNLTPFIFYSCLSANELKSYFTKKIWERLCQNSFSRNKLIALRTKRELMELSVVKVDKPEKRQKRSNRLKIYDAPSLIEYFNNFPSTILKLPYLEINNSTIALSNCCKPKEFIKEYNYSNSGSLYKKIFEYLKAFPNEDVNLNLTKEQWINKHKELFLNNSPF
jgi:hypothetical protein